MNSSQNDYLTLFNKHRRSTITKVRRSFVLELFDIKSRGLIFVRVLDNSNTITPFLRNEHHQCLLFILFNVRKYMGKNDSLILQYHSVTVELGNFVKKALYHFLFGDFKLEETLPTESNHTLFLVSWWIG